MFWLDRLLRQGEEEVFDLFLEEGACVVAAAGTPPDRFWLPRPGAVV